MAELKVKLNERTTKVVEGLAKQRGISETDLVARALALYRYAYENADPAGKPTLTLMHDGKTQEVEL